MIENVPTFLKVVSSAASALKWFSDLNKKTKGDVRALLEEMKENSRLCFRFIDDNADLNRVVSQFSTSVFDRLNESGFDFDAVKRQPIPNYAQIGTTELAAWGGKSTGNLVKNIYDKIKDIRSLQQFPGPNRRMNRRVINIHSRILLLLRHVGSK
jgi:hypothetical protein